MRCFFNISLFLLLFVSCLSANEMNVDIQFFSDISSTNLSQSGNNSTIKLIVRDNSTNNLISGVNINCSAKLPGYSDDDTQELISSFTETSTGIYELNVDNNNIWIDFGPVFTIIGKSSFNFELECSGYDTLATSSTATIVDCLDHIVSVPDNYWIISPSVVPELQKEISYNGISYTCYKMWHYDADAEYYTQQSKWLVVGPNGVVSDENLYSTIAVVAEIQEWDVDSLADALDSIADDYEDIIFGTDVVAFGQTIRDTAAGCLGAVLSSYYTGGVTLGTQASVLLEESADMLAENFIENRISAISDPMEWYRNSIKNQFSTHAQELRVAALQIRNRGTDWEPHEAKYFWQNCRDGLVNGLPLCNAIVQALPETDLMSQLTEILIEAAKGADPSGGALLVSHAIMIDLKNLPEQQRIYTECYYETDELDSVFSETRDCRWDYPSDLVSFYQNNPLFNTPLELTADGPWTTNISQSYTISGNVTQDGSYVSNADIIVNLNGSKVATAKTNTSGNFSIDLTAPGTAGSYTVSINADHGAYSLDDAVESTLTIVDPIEGYDFAVSDIEGSSSADNDSDVTLKIYVANLGDYIASGSLSIQLYDPDNNPTGTEQQFSISQLPAGNQTFIEASIQTGSDDGYYIVKCTAACNVGDEDWSNNTRTHHILVGDRPAAQGHEVLEHIYSLDNVNQPVSFGPYTIYFTGLNTSTGLVNVERIEPEIMDNFTISEGETKAFGNANCVVHYDSWMNVGNVAVLNLGSATQNLIAQPAEQTVIHGEIAEFQLNANVNIYNANVLTGWFNGDSINGKDSYTSNGNILSYYVDTDNLSPGDYQWFIRVTGINDFTFFQKLTLTVLPQPVHDLIIESITPQEDRIYRVGETVQFAAVVNRTEDHTELATLTLTAEDSSGINRLISTSVETITGQTSLTYSWDTSLLPSDDYTICLDGTITGEANSGNNNATCTVCLLGPQTYYVDIDNADDTAQGGSADHPFDSIQTAIDAAFSGDTVIVSPGHYVENISFDNKDIVLTATDPDNSTIREQTVIDGGQNGSVVTFGGEETEDCELSGFTITNGLAENGGGVNGNGTEATIAYCYIHTNTANENGGGIYSISGLLHNDLIVGNKANAIGGIYSIHEVDIINCSVIDNYPISIGISGIRDFYNNICNALWFYGDNIDYNITPSFVTNCIGNIYESNVPFESYSFYLETVPFFDEMSMVECTIVNHSAEKTFEIECPDGFYDVTLEWSGYGDGTNTMTMYSSGLHFLNISSGYYSFTTEIVEDKISFSFLLDEVGQANISLNDIKIKPKTIHELDSQDYHSNWFQVKEIDFLGWSIDYTEGGFYDYEIGSNNNVISIDAGWIRDEFFFDYGIVKATNSLNTNIELNGKVELNLDYKASCSPEFSYNYPLALKVFTHENGSLQMVEADLIRDDNWHKMSISFDEINSSVFYIEAYLDSSGENTVELNIKDLSICEYAKIEYNKVSFVSNGIWLDDVYITGDYHLLSESFCIDTGSTSSDYSNEPMPNGGRINLGAYGNTPEAARSSVIEFLGYQIVSETVIDESIVEYEVAVEIKNNSTTDLSNVLLSLIDNSDEIAVIGDRSINVPSISAGQSLITSDTFTIQLDMSTALDDGQFIWDIAYYDTVQQQPAMQMTAAAIATHAVGDITGEGEVNLLDFNSLAAQWLQSSEGLSADISAPADGIVDIVDLNTMISNWLNSNNQYKIVQ